MRQKDYIKSPQHWKDMYSHVAVNGEWKPVDRIPIKKIRVKKSLLSFPNEVDPAQVDDIVNNFSQEVWIPILVNQDFFLLDGQHRLAVAKKMRLKYIDVIVENRQLLKRSATMKQSRLNRLVI